MRRYASLGIKLVSPDGVTYQSGIPFAELQYPNQNFKYITVKNNEVGRLDIVAYRAFNDCSLWQPIAVLNNIIDPISEVYAGRVLAIPTTQITIQSYADATYEGT
jgi:hypothetical protein